MTSSVLESDLAEVVRCPACHATGLTLEADGRAACPACGARYAADPESAVCALLAARSDSPVKGDIRDWWGDLYRQRHAEDDRMLDARSFDRALDQLRDLFEKRRHLAVVEMPLADLAGKTVLEIGSGAGAHASLFKRLGASVTAVDITPERVAGTAARLALVAGGSGRAYQADAENLPFRDACFDIVYSNGVLHHSETTTRCIGEVYRVLRPGGRAVIMLYSRHSSVFWFNIVPRAIVTGAMFGRRQAHWIGRLTEGKPRFGTTRNPLTRVYSERQLRALFARFTILGLRKSSFQFDNFCIPRLTQMRNAVLCALGHAAHPGGIPVYGAPFVPETALELWLGRYLGWCWNVVAEKPVE